MYSRLYSISNVVTPGLNSATAKNIIKNYVTVQILRRRKSYVCHARRTFKTRYNVITYKNLWQPKCRSISTGVTMLTNNCGSGKKIEKQLTLETVNPNPLKMKFEINGGVTARANAIEQELEKGEKKPFKNVIRVHIGDPHAMLQKPVTFTRQLISAVFYPELLNKGVFPEDIVERAKCILKHCGGGSIGSYTPTPGHEIIRREVANFIEERDGYPTDYKNIFLTDGILGGFRTVLPFFDRKVDCKPAGVMLSIPQYPMFAGTIAQFGLHQIDYYLHEETEWSLEIKELQRAYDESLDKCNPRAIIIVNPGNPTGQVLTKQNIEEIIKFAHKNRLVILVDEVYQRDIWDENTEFFSFKKVMLGMGEPYSQMELISFMGPAKGYTSESAVRGGYMEMLNIDPDLMDALMRTIFTIACSNTAGQLAVSSMVNLPKEGDPSYEKYKEETNFTFCSLKERANMVYETFKTFEGFKVIPVKCAYYIFPSVTVPPKAIEAAKKKNMPPDGFYCMELLEKYGVNVVPGYGFGQKPGTYHFRCTTLPPTPIYKEMLERFKKFHIEFMQKYK